MIRHMDASHIANNVINLDKDRYSYKDGVLRIKSRIYTDVVLSLSEEIPVEQLYVLLEGIRKAYNYGMRDGEETLQYQYRRLLGLEG